MEAEEAQLEAEEAEAVATFERCLVPCCREAQVWLRYASYLEANPNPNPNPNPNQVWLRYASYLEARRNVEGARAVLVRAGSTALEQHPYTQPQPQP